MLRCPAAIKPYVDNILQSGIAVIPASLPMELCDRVREGFVNFTRKNAGIFDQNRDRDGHYPRIVNLHTAYTALFDLFHLNGKALALQDFLFGRETALYTSLYYERGSAQDIHRDTPYFATKPEYQYFGMWVALEDTDECNGPLIIVRRGHLIPEFDRETIARRFYPDLSTIDPGSDELFNAYQAEVNRKCEELGLVTEKLCVRKGDTVIWHAQAPHGGAAIRDLKRTRHSIVMHTTPLGVPVYHQDVFFNPSKPVSDQAPWRYVEVNSRKYADFRDVSFGHVRTYATSEFMS